MSEEYTPQFDFDGNKDNSEIRTCMWCGRKGKGLVLVNDVCQECAKKLYSQSTPVSKGKPSHREEAKLVETQSEIQADDEEPATGSGKLIQVQAGILMILGIAVSIITGIYVCTFGDRFFLPGIVIMIVGSVVSWILMTVLRGFGEMVESNMHIEKLLKKIVRK